MAFDIRDHLTQEQQMSEAFLLSLILAFSGGFQDAYTYTVRDHVYANAQTGNVVMMSANCMRGDWDAVPRYLLPLLAFALGVFAAELIHQYYEDLQRRCHALGDRHWRRDVVALEGAIMLVVGFLGQNRNLEANCLVSFACAMQVQSFRTVHGYAYASTMCIGNLRGCMSALAKFVYNKDRSGMRRAGYYAGVIFAFAVGAGMGCICAPALGDGSIWICCLLLGISYWLMGWQGRGTQNKAG